MEYYIGDTHFNHENIIKYCDRPFENVKEMDEFIIDQWNKVVKEGDIVYHLGDFSFNMLDENIKDLINKLNGDIILIRGNHDRKGKKKLKKLGFKEVYDKLVIDKKILTHRPLEDVKEGYINIHGHIHNSEGGLGVVDRRLNVSCEIINYKPIDVTKLI